MWVLILLSVIPSTVWTVSEGVLYKQCSENCSCCINAECGQGAVFPDECLKGCIDGRRGARCHQLCQYENCKSCGGNTSSTECEACYDGYYLGANKDCSSQCPSNCKSCTSSTRCTECKEGFFGGDGSTTCQYANCECVSCSKYCKEQVCVRESGVCIGGCSSENITGETCDRCIAGTYGELCGNSCPQKCKNNMCGRHSGTCSEGCIENFNGTKCDDCIHGKYGDNCMLDCPVNCAGGFCERSTGTCYDCIDNFQGETCTECLDSYYGPNCNETCSPHCANKTCNRDSGECISGCTTGYSGDKCCALSDYCDECYNVTECKTCRRGYFMNACNESCPQDCLTSCDISTGECEGHTDERQNPAGPISWLVAIIVVVTVIFISTIFLRRRKKKYPPIKESVDIRHLPSDRSAEDVQTVKDAPFYANIIDKTEPGATLVDETKDIELDDAADYYNCNSVNINVQVADLFSYVTKDNFDYFEKEFENLQDPDHLSISCKIATKPENIASNRYDGIYPFDHSRVTIPGQTKFYINACYIDGYNRSKAYIASFGPTIKHTSRFKTFWQMVWHEKSDIIVMLTNLREASKMKCEQYWPEIKTEESYGHIKVKCRSIEEFAEYTVRSFTISKGNEHRSLTQLHFTAWPDQGVPSEVTSLVEFRHRVKAVPVVLGGPVIVHCSAGIGRTGTYIALDILSEQGKAEHSVNIFNCVSKMRRQRVYMVQTVEQYIFLHKALVHTLLFGCESQTVEEIKSLAFDADGALMHMFQTLQHEIDFEGEDEISAREENRRDHADKSRRHSDIPGHRGRVRLYLNRKSGCHDYINAVFISSFKIKDLFIAAQTPQSSTLEDFLCMIYQQNISCVVALEDQIQLSMKHDIGIYLPADNETYKCGDFTVMSLKLENKTNYSIKKLIIKRTDKGEKKTSYHFQYTKWRNGQKVADSPGDFVYFVKHVEKYVKLPEARMTSVLVHCLNGYEKSGLFCVVYTLLEKLEAEGQVSVVNVIRKVRAQRKLSIISVEQLKFCYQCASAFTGSNSTNNAVTAN